MINDPPDGWGEMSYGEKEAWRRGQQKRHSRNQAAYAELSEGQNVKTPDGWVGFIAEKHPDGERVYVESWDRAGHYDAAEVEPVDDMSGVSL